MKPSFPRDSYGFFAQETDDGQAIDRLGEADVILIGPSGIGKSTICAELAKLGLRAANIPLTPSQHPYGGCVLSSNGNLASLIQRGHPPVIGLYCDYRELSDRRIRAGKLPIHQRLASGTAHDCRAAHAYFRAVGCQILLDTTNLSASSCATEIKDMLAPPPPSAKADKSPVKKEKRPAPH